MNAQTAAKTLSGARRASGNWVIPIELGNELGIAGAPSRGPAGKKIVVLRSQFVTSNPN
jgi:hypothetical protein